MTTEKQGQDGVSQAAKEAALEVIKCARQIQRAMDARSTPPAPAPGSVRKDGSPRPISQAAQDACGIIVRGIFDHDPKVLLSEVIQKAIDTETFDLVDELQLAEGKIEGLTADLAAAQAVNVKLREALVTILVGASGEHFISSIYEGLMTARTALTDTAALGGFVAVEKWKLDRLEATAKSWHEATLGKDAQAILDEWIKRGGFDDDPSLGKLQGIIQIKMNDLRHQNAALLELVAAWEALDSCQNDPARARFRSEIKTLKKKAGL